MRRIGLLLVVLTAPALADDDPCDRAELGWRAYHRHELDKAEKLTRAAVADCDRTEIVRAALYNLGVILEDRGDKRGAIDAYSDSLRHDNRAVVRDRLAKLDPSAADSFDELRPKPMQGPFTSMKEYCKRYQASASECEAAAVLKPDTAFVAKEPIRNAALSVFEQEGVGLLQIDVGGQLYVVELPTFANEGTPRTNATWQLAGFIRHGATLEVSYYVTGHWQRRPDEGFEWRETDSVVVGIGGSKKPSATPAYRFALDVSDLDGTHAEVVRKPTWSKDGSAVDVAVVKDAKRPGDTEQIKGHHRLAFP